MTKPAPSGPTATQQNPAKQPHSPSAPHLDRALPKEKVKEYEEEIKLHETFGGD